VLTLRCTQRLVRRLGSVAQVEPYAPTTALGDWYANVLYTRPRQLILCVSERSLLSVLVPARDPTTFLPRFRETVLSHLTAIGASVQAVAAEGEEMKEIRVGRTASRSVLGSMRDLALTVQQELALERWASLEDLQLHLSTFIMGAIGMRYPCDVALELLQRPRSK